MLATVADLTDLEPSELASHFSRNALRRGGHDARRNRVLSLKWEEDERALRASVVGQGARYATAAYFDDDGGGRLTFAEGECTCPIGYNCKHVAAVVLAASERLVEPLATTSVTDYPVGRAAVPAPVPAARPSAWEQSLRALVATRSRATGKPLAIELRLVSSHYAGDGSPRLMARLMRPGARGGWVNGSLDWGGLGSWQLRDGGYREDHIALMNELHAVTRLRDADIYYYGYRTSKEIDFSA
ncbi:MAG: SWIM zinc finger family protein, partial [Solirubrobacterales bacterium]|nr:SWIM zinc finger family protein [Solirubrobacterales bacterium]